MSKVGKLLIDAMEEARTIGLVDIQVSPDVAALRKRLRLSQKQFSETYHIKPETLKKWEQKKRMPDSISRVYLRCIEKAPDVIKQLIA